MIEPNLAESTPTEGSATCHRLLLPVTVCRCCQRSRWPRSRCFRASAPMAANQASAAERGQMRDERTHARWLVPRRLRVGAGARMVRGFPVWREPSGLGLCRGLMQYDR